MSSATAIHYTVEQIAAMREAAALAHERSRLRVLHDELSSLTADARAVAETYGTQVAVPAPVRLAGTSDAVRAAADRLERTMAQARAALDSTRRSLRGARLRERLAGAIPPATGRAPTATRAAASRLTGTEAGPAAHAPALAPAVTLGARVEACLDALDDGVDLTEDFVRLAKTLAGVDAPGAGDVMAFRALQDEVGRLNRRERARRATLAAIRELDVRLGALPDDLGPGTAGVRVTLDEARRAAERGAAPDVSVLAEMVARAEAEYRREVDRRHVEQSLAAILAGLGYDVAEGFEKAVPHGGRLVRKAAWAHHGVRVEVEDDEITLDVVRIAPEQGATPAAVRDEEAEVAFCADVPALLEDLERAGVGLVKVTRIPPGVVSVPQLGVPADAEQRARATARRRPGRERAL